MAVRFGKMAVKMAVKQGARVACHSGRYGAGMTEAETPDEAESDEVEGAPYWVLRLEYVRPDGIVHAARVDVGDDEDLGAFLDEAVRAVRLVDEGRPDGEPRPLGRVVVESYDDNDDGLLVHYDPYPGAETVTLDDLVAAHEARDSGQSSKSETAVVCRHGRPKDGPCEGCDAYGRCLRGGDDN